MSESPQHLWAKVIFAHRRGKKMKLLPECFLVNWFHVQLMNVDSNALSKSFSHFPPLLCCSGAVCSTMLPLIIADW